MNGEEGPPEADTPESEALTNSQDRCTDGEFGEDHKLKVIFGAQVVPRPW